MSNFKKFFLINENDFNLLKKSKGEQQLDSHQTVRNSSADVDVQNNLALNKRLMESSRAETRTSEEELPVVKRSRSVVEQDEEAAIGDDDDGKLSMDDSVDIEDQDALIDQKVDGKLPFFDLLRDYLPPKLVDQGETFAKRVLNIDGVSLNWGEKQTVVLGENTFSVVDFMDFVLMSSQRRKPVQSEKLSNFVSFLMKNDFPTTLIANPYIRTMAIASRFDETKLESSPGGSIAKLPKSKSKSILFSSPIKFDWYNSTDDVPD